MRSVIMLGAFAGVAVLVWWALSSLRQHRQKAPAAPRRRAPVMAVREVDSQPNEAVPPDEAGAPDETVDAPAPLPPPTLALLREESLTPAARQRLQALAGAVPRPRTVFLELLQTGGDPLELARVVAGDPAAAALLLRTVNSAQFQLAREITSVQRAITYLGANLVRDIAIRHALAGSQTGTDHRMARVHEALWSSSHIASAIAFSLAQQLRLSGAAELSTQTLLFNLGDIALVVCHPQLVELYSGEGGLHERVDGMQRELGYNAALAGAHLGNIWQLPLRLCRVLGASLAPLSMPQQDLDPELLQGVALGYFANRLAEVLSAQSVFQLQAGIDNLIKRPEAAMLPEYLAAGGLGNALTALTDPALERRLAAIHASAGAGRRRAPTP